MKFALSAMAAIALMVGISAAQPAQARCFWNGFAIECYHPYHSWWWRHHHYYPDYWRY